MTYRRGEEEIPIEKYLLSNCSFGNVSIDGDVLTKERRYMKGEGKMKKGQKIKMIEKLQTEKDDLLVRIREMQASTLYALKYAYEYVERAGFEHFMGSGVIVELRGIGGKSITAPFILRDGMSPETIEYLKKDIARSQSTKIDEAKIKQ